MEAAMKQPKNRTEWVPVLTAATEAGRWKASVDVYSLAKSLNTSVAQMCKFARAQGLLVRQGRRKLTAADVEQIRAKIAQGISQADIAAEYDYDDGNINKIARGKIWNKS